MAEVGYIDLFYYLILLATPKQHPTLKKKKT